MFSDFYGNPEVIRRLQETLKRDRFPHAVILAGPEGAGKYTLALKLARMSTGVVAVLATTVPQPSLVLSQSAGQPFDMGALMKETMAKLGGRGGGTRDLAQGGLPNPSGVVEFVDAVTARFNA